MMISNAASAKEWLFGTAIPLWLDIGTTADGLAVEELDFQARPRDVGYHRTMVQFRQAFCFAKAALAGGCDASVARELFLRASAAAKHPDGGWVHKHNSDGTLQDTTRDVCDQAFGLLAAAWTYKASGDAGILAAHQHALNFVDAQAGEGYAEAMPSRLPRRQNTHMHLLESFLALYEATGDDGYRARAEAIITLLKTKFVNPDGFLFEYFDVRLSPLSGPDNWIEPGHHFEWVWLLQEYARLSGSTISPMADRLFAMAVRHGLDADGFAVAKISPDGRILDGRRILWAQLEMLKAYLVRGEDARPILANIARFLPSSPAGIWYEKLDENGNPVRNRMPASTFYHVTGAFTELLNSTKATA